MSDRPFTQFISLVNLDQKIQSFVNKKIAVDVVIAQITIQKNTQETLISELKKKIIQLKKNVDAQELEMKILDEKENEKKKILSTLTDYKECQAIKNEVDAIQRLQVAQEKIVLDAWNQLENAQQLMVKREAESKDELHKLDDNLEKTEQEKLAISDELSLLSAQRDEKSVGIPEEWLEKYGEMGQRVTDPVVPIEQQSCGGCYQQLTVQDIIRAKRGALMQCKKCFRLLYFPEIVQL